MYNNTSKKFAIVVRIEIHYRPYKHKLLCNDTGLMIVILCLTTPVCVNRLCVSKHRAAEIWV